MLSSSNFDLLICMSPNSVEIIFVLHEFLQILKTGFFHADPHPGNLAIDKDQAIIYYDFGMMGEIQTSTRERLLDLFYAVYEKDAKKVCFNILLLQPHLLVVQPNLNLEHSNHVSAFFWKGIRC